MADVLSLAMAAGDRRLAAGAGGGRYLDHYGGADEEGYGSPGMHGIPGRADRALPGSAASSDWQLPLPPVRFPLREALMSLEDQYGVIQPEAPLPVKGPLKISLTQKTKAIREIGRMKRSGQLTSGLIEERPQPMPIPPPDVDKPRTPPKVLASLATNTKIARRRRAEEVGMEQWQDIQESHSSPSLGSTGLQAHFQHTWTSAARAVISHSRRFPGPSVPTDQFGHSTLDDAGSRWAGAHLQSYRHLPRPVKEWAQHGLEFTDRGLGIGDRFELEVSQLAKRSPGPVYEAAEFGSVSLWRKEAASQPTKQPSSKHVSTRVHKIGARWKDDIGPDRQTPEPGRYEIPGFVDELQRKYARRAKGGTQSDMGATMTSLPRSPSSSPKGRSSPKTPKPPRATAAAES